VVDASDRGWRAQAEIEIAAPAERVWGIVSDISRHPQLAGSGEVLAVRLHGPLAVGTTFDSDVRTGEVGSFSPRCVIEAVEAPRHLGWVSLFPLEEGETEDHQIEVHWAYDIDATPAGTRVVHRVHIPPPRAGADELADFFARTDRMTTVRRGMERTLDNIRAAAESGTGAGEAPAASWVRSRDGTEIAFWQTGSGPPLVLVHGTPADHTRWEPLLGYLEPHFSVCAIDRRGRGASGDAPSYALEREFEDAAAVVDAVAARSGGPVSVYGHSHGGIVAFGAATLTPNIDRLVLYEGWPVPDPRVFALPADLETRMDQLLAAGDRDGVVELLFRGLEDVSDEDMAALRAAPSWAGRVAAAHTITREIRAELTARLDPDVARSITRPVLLVVGEHSSDATKPCAELVAESLPNARVAVLDGQEHIADILDPEGFAARVVPFLQGRA